jgi:septal ring factor EnvC (AmiA/AmiB activator)
MSAIPPPLRAPAPAPAGHDGLRRVPGRGALGLALLCSLALGASAVAGVPAAAAGAAQVAATVPASAAVAPAGTDPDKAKKQVDKEIESLKEELEDTSASLKNAYVALRRTQAAMPGAQAALDKATAALSRADAYNDAMAVQLGVAEANEARAVDELAKTRAELADSRQRVARFASQLYQDQGMG